VHLSSRHTGEVTADGSTDGGSDIASDVVTQIRIARQKVDNRCMPSHDHLRPVHEPEQPAHPAGATSRQRDIVVIGASAGGVETLKTLVPMLPAELPAAVFVVLHMMPGGTSVLPRILARHSALAVASAEDGEPVERGRIYVAPPDHHMLLADGRVRLTRGPRENGHRPAVDPLFRSAARGYENRVVGVVLSGALDDGTAGLKMIRDNGGATIVQDPDEATYPSMPRSALEHEPLAEAVAIAGMAERICELVDEQLDPRPTPPADDPPEETDQPDRADDDPRAGMLTGITCPECGGALWEHDENGLLRFKCHVGHAYSVESLDSDQSDSLEGALWAALRNLQERGDLFRRLSRRAGGDQRLDAKARTADRHAGVLRSFVTSFGREPGEAGDSGLELRR
jgi:two-component system chemotaxis response regulator CheB